jgi:hypothetical protein
MRPLRSSPLPLRSKKTKNPFMIELLNVVGLSQAEASLKMGVSRALFNWWLMHSGPPLSRLPEVQKKLKIDPAFFWALVRRHYGR